VFQVIVGVCVCGIFAFRLLEYSAIHKARRLSSFGTYRNHYRDIEMSAIGGAGRINISR
jgi:hypothetical protein